MDKAFAAQPVLLQSARGGIRAVKIYWSGLRRPAGVRRKTFLERFQMAMARGCCAVKVSLSGRRCPVPDKR